MVLACFEGETSDAESTVQLESDVIHNGCYLEGQSHLFHRCLSSVHQHTVESYLKPSSSFLSGVDVLLGDLDAFEKALLRVF
jgi:hypothetical protein